jgi:hypothetical protein
MQLKSPHEKVNSTSSFVSSLSLVTELYVFFRLRLLTVLHRIFHNNDRSVEVKPSRRSVCYTWGMYLQSWLHSNYEAIKLVQLLSYPYYNFNSDIGLV